MKPTLAACAFVIAVTAGAAYAAAPETVADALAGCCAFLSSLCCPC